MSTDHVWASFCLVVSTIEASKMTYGQSMPYYSLTSPNASDIPSAFLRMASSLFPSSSLAPPSIPKTSLRIDLVYALVRGCVSSGELVLMDTVSRASTAPLVVVGVVLFGDRLLSLAGGMDRIRLMSFASPARVIVCALIDMIAGRERQLLNDDGRRGRVGAPGVEG
jgi:hypothetical protein